MQNGMKNGKPTPEGRPKPLRDEVGKYHDLDLDPLIGQVIDNRYLFGSVLGEGSMGRVYAAKDLEKDEMVAIKIMSSHSTYGLGDSITVNRFIREAETAAAIKHPNVILVKDIRRSGDLIYQVMELLEGESLDKILKNEPRGLEMGKFKRIIRQVCAGVQAAHNEQVIHRDLKPANIMIGGKKGDETATVMDFGIAKFGVNETLLTQPGSVLGTPQYMSPEQCKGADCDRRADIYSIGAIAYELLAGTAPFTGTLAQVLSAHMNDVPEPLSKRRPGIDKNVEAAIMKALEKKPEDRHQSVDEFFNAMFASATQTHVQQPRPALDSTGPRLSAHSYESLDEEPHEGRTGTIVKAVATLAVIGAITIVGYVYRDDISNTVEGWLKDARSQVAQENDQTQTAPSPVDDENKFPVTVKAVNSNGRELKADIFKINPDGSEEQWKKTPLELRLSKGDRLRLRHKGRKQEVVIQETGVLEVKF